MERLLILVAALLALAACRPAPLTAPAAAAYGAYMTTNCPLESEEALADGLRRYAQEVEPHLLNAFVKGPSPQAIQRIVDHANEQFNAIQTGRKNLKAQAEAVSRPAFVARVREDYVDSFRLAALNGLSLTRGTEAIKKLQSVASDTKSPYREEATEILSRTAQKERD